MKKIRVAFFAEILIQDLDGAARTMFQLIGRIDPARFEFLFFCGKGPDQLAGFTCCRLPVVRLPATTYSMALPALAKKSMTDRLLEFRPDVIHIATPSLLGGFAVKFAKLYQLPVLTIYHTHFISYMDYYLSHTPFLVHKARKMIAGTQRWFYNQCDTVYVPSGSIQTELEEMGIDAWRMKRWQRGIDTGLFSPLKRDPRVIERITGNDRPVVFFASRLVWEKNLETLFRIYDLLQAVLPDVNILIAGDGIARKACQFRMKKAFFVGMAGHETLSVLYASASVFLFPSVSETYGNVIAEAMASGLPCVIADGGGSSDFIRQGVNGFKCRPYDEYDYVEKIRLLLENQLLHDQFSREGLADSRLLDWDKLAETYFDDLAGLVRSTRLAVV
ncbi:glycosyltransferase [Hufsiella ginkgonis]|uniref:Glycosyltransferase n=1 Tax=Hufsiella ginkgonis TaxID=2695274 RepID=A0A7K1XZH5_9SPHI|nr:glycosyltransferase [Hufsiella ginkgonis]MXV16352.1 glycosyltransferase [Hufsiella ginkgonis]